MRDVIVVAGKAMRYIPSAIFVMGSDGGYPEEAPPHTVEIRDFYLDESPVTNSEYKAFCDATGKNYPRSPEWEEFSDYFNDCPDSPVVMVSHHDALDYARWAGKRLPTEAEWEYAASGGYRGAVYPWGTNEYEAHKYANFADCRSEYEWRSPYFSDIHRHASPVKSYLPNHFGLYDMAGNVWEWTGDYFYSYYAASAQNALDSAAVVQRGGCYHSTTRDLRIARRRRANADEAVSFCGFRCALNAASADKLLVGDRSADLIHSPQQSLFIGQIPNVKSAQLPVRRESVSNRPAPPDGIGLCAVFYAPCAVEPLTLAELGFTVVEQYIDWRSCEGSARGNWDFSKWDKLRRAAREAGLGWRPCLLAGPNYSLPRWYLESGEFTSSVCLEHNLSSLEQSVWDKHFPRHLERFFAAAADYFGDDKPIDGLSLAVCDIYGAEYPSHVNLHGTLKAGWRHCHPGFWCGDAFAREAFCAAMQKKYGEIARLNEAWSTRFADFDRLAYPDLFTSPGDFRVDEPTSAGRFRCELLPERRRLVDFIDWYRASMTDYCAEWLRLARKYFPRTPLTLCVGGGCESWLGSDLEEQVKTAAEYGASVCVISGGHSDFGFYAVNPAVSACEFYGAEFDVCPQNPNMAKSAAMAVYSAAASGARELRTCGCRTIQCGNSVNLLQEISDALSGNLCNLSERKSASEIAVLIPDLPALFDPYVSRFIRIGIERLRDLTDFICIGDRMIADGALGKVKALFIFIGGVYRGETLRKIKRFVSSGGLLVAIGVGELTALDGDLTGRFDYMEALLRRRGNGTRKIGRGATLRLELIRDVGIKHEVPQNYPALISEFLCSYGVELSDGVLDGTYTARLAGSGGSEEILLTYSESEGIKVQKNGFDR